MCHMVLRFLGESETSVISCNRDCETYLVCLQGLSFDGQRHIGEGFRVQELIEHRQQVCLVVVPPQTESLGRHGSLMT